MTAPGRSLTSRKGSASADIFLARVHHQAGLSTLQRGIQGNSGFQLIALPDRQQHFFTQFYLVGMSASQVVVCVLERCCAKGSGGRLDSTLPPTSRRSLSATRYVSGWIDSACNMPHWNSPVITKY